ncbi:uncharacterized protein LOC132270055 [Cornus florida]|uniref:uncharacterized protein LOC132270055 n=1 Tax=Cornus florida TaxID=4283 RepID=UPI002898F32F|nr:uncharacterized protein LOC132270055 [Cornus florida]
MWDLLTDNSDRIWIKWCKVYLIKGRNLWSLDIPYSCSWSWRKLLQLRHPTWFIIKHQICNGSSTNFWFDNWLPGGPLSLRFPSQLLFNAGYDTATTVSCFISNNYWSFPLSLSSVTSELLPLPAPSSNENDKLLWSIAPSGKFSLKHTSAYFSPSSPQVPWYNLVWWSPAIPRMKFNL